MEYLVTHSCSCPENSKDGGAWWAAIHGVTQSQTRLKRLSSSSVVGGFLSHSIDQHSKPLDGLEGGPGTEDLIH